MKEKALGVLAIAALGTFVTFCSMIGSIAADGWEYKIAEIAQKRAKKKAAKASK